MGITEVTQQATDALTVRRVFGDPFEKDGTTVLPVAAVRGGGGGGAGHDQSGQEGEGAGFGVAARPAGAYVLTGNRVSWHPAVDVNRMLTVAGAVVVAWLLTRSRRRSA